MLDGMLAGVRADRAGNPLGTFADLLPPGKPPRFARKLGVSLALALLLLVCGCSLGRSAAFHPLSDRRYPARPEPAEISTAGESELTSRGYEPVGTVQVRQRVRHCKAERCWDLSHEPDANQAARQLAGENGGELLVLSRDNELERNERDLRERCKTPAMHGSLSGGFAIGETEDCLDWELVHEVWEYRISAGTVWRKATGDR